MARYRRVGGGLEFVVYREPSVSGGSHLAAMG